MEELTILIAGSAGQGIQTIGEVISRSAREQGYYVFSWQEFESRIRGGQNSFRVRISHESRNAPSDGADLILALNTDAAEKYLPLINKNGVVLAPSSDYQGIIEMDFNKIASEAGGNKIHTNAVAAGAVAAATGMDPGTVEQALSAEFADKGQDVIDKNRTAFQAGYKEARKACGDLCQWKIPAREENRQGLVNVHQAIAVGAAYAGCSAMFAYPMSPSTSIITYIAQHKDELGMFWEQAEDEIAAVNMAIGASYAGARAMTATSGGGFALMTEAISLAGMTETPVVIILAQRPGPATGLPTRTAQGDLLFAINAGHGEFVKMVLAPADPADAFHGTVQAFNLADKYQIPVIILTDQFLADAHFTQDVHPERSQMQSFLSDACSKGEYRRYAINPEGISPRLYPGQGKQLVCADSDEHDETGHITEDLGNMVPTMVEKRKHKLNGLKDEIPKPEMLQYDTCDTILLCWGSTRNAVIDALGLLEADGIKAGMVHYSFLWPLQKKNLNPQKSYITVENNATSQLAKLLSQETGLQVSKTVNRIDGLPITGEFIRERILEDLA